MNDDWMRRLRLTPLRLGLVALAAAGATVLVLLLYANISARKQEARQPFFKVVELDERTVDPSVWGRTFPSQYQSYLRTVEDRNLITQRMGRTTFGYDTNGRLGERIDISDLGNPHPESWRWTYDRAGDPLTNPGAAARPTIRVGVRRRVCVQAIRAVPRAR